MPTVCTVDVVITDHRSTRRQTVQSIFQTQALVDGSPLQGAVDGGLSRLLARALDEVDYGIVLLRSFGRVLHLNHQARRRLEAGGPLQLVGDRLTIGDERVASRFGDALRAAADRGMRRLVDIGADARQHVALVPVEAGVAALLLGKASVCEDLAIQHFARTHDLTPAETRVLAALGAGAAPAAIALEQGVKLSTVRTQIGAIREKTGAASITALVRMVAALPPMVSALRH
jgi:DNA-binding CsgD family transcriptional regulator